MRGFHNPDLWCFPADSAANLPPIRRPGVTPSEGEEVHRTRPAVPQRPPRSRARRSGGRYIIDEEDAFVSGEIPARFKTSSNIPDPTLVGQGCLGMRGAAMQKGVGAILDVEHPSDRPSDNVGLIKSARREAAGTGWERHDHIPIDRCKKLGDSRRDLPGEYRTEALTRAVFYNSDDVAERAVVRGKISLESKRGGKQPTRCAPTVFATREEFAPTRDASHPMTRDYEGRRAA